jgi:hypothetical protein
MSSDFEDLVHVKVKELNYDDNSSNDSSNNGDDNHGNNVRVQVLTDEESYLVFGGNGTLS